MGMRGYSRGKDQHPPRIANSNRYCCCSEFQSIRSRHVQKKRMRFIVQGYVLCQNTIDRSARDCVSAIQRCRINVARRVSKQRDGRSREVNLETCTSRGGFVRGQSRCFVFCASRVVRRFIAAGIHCLPAMGAISVAIWRVDDSGRLVRNGYVVRVREGSHADSCKYQLHQEDEAEEGMAVRLGR